jgi:hypothetical protein
MAERAKREGEEPESDCSGGGPDPPDDNVEVGREGREGDPGEDRGEEEEERAERPTLRDSHAATLAAAGAAEDRQYNQSAEPVGA